MHGCKYTKEQKTVIVRWNGEVVDIKIDVQKIKPELHWKRMHSIRGKSFWQESWLKLWKKAGKGAGVAYCVVWLWDVDITIRRKRQIRGTRNMYMEEIAKGKLKRYAK